MVIRPISQEIQPPQREAPEIYPQRSPDITPHEPGIEIAPPPEQPEIFPQHSPDATPPPQPERPPVHPS